MQPLGDIFEGMRNRARPVDRLPDWARGIPPAVKICETREELADWFQEFALACRFARVSPTG